MGLPIAAVETEGCLRRSAASGYGQGASRQELAEPPGFAGTAAALPASAASPGWPPCSDYGLGACLADDMGLGKTVQLIALCCTAAASGYAADAC